MYVLYLSETMSDSNERRRQLLSMHGERPLQFYTAPANASSRQQWSFIGLMKHRHTQGFSLAAAGGGGVTIGHSLDPFINLFYSPKTGSNYELLLHEHNTFST